MLGKIINEYNSKGKLIHYKNDRLEFWCEYDSKGNRTHYKDNAGNEKWYKYNQNNNRIHYKDSSGYEAWYDEYENIIREVGGEEMEKAYNAYCDRLFKKNDEIFQRVNDK